jgi:hypothetical protein
LEGEEVGVTKAEDADGNADDTVAVTEANVFFIPPPLLGDGLGK